MAPFAGLLAAAVAVVEIYLMVRVGQLIGVLPTVLLLLALSLVGGRLLRREGSRAWRELRRGLATGRLPDREVADGGVLLLAGALLVAPGFLTDALALVLLLPATRPWGRRLLRLPARRRPLSRSRPGGPQDDRVIDVTAERRPPPSGQLGP